MATAFQTYNVSPNPNDAPGAAAVPVASIVMWPTATAPSGWLLCNGAAVNRSLYAHLFSVIGTTYGVGDGSTTFNLPSFSGRVPRGVNGTYTLAGTGGADSVNLIATDLPYHAHNVTDLGHSHTLNNVAPNNQFNNGTAGVNRFAEINGNVNATNAATTGITIQPSLLDGSGNPVFPNNRTLVNIVNTYLGINYIIKSA